MLRLVAFSAVGAGIVLGARGLVGSAFPQPAANTSTSTSSSSASLTTTTGVPSGSQSSSSSQQIKVKVMYFQMPLVVGNSEEHFEMQSPAQFSGLLPQVLAKHPALQPMLPTMMILIDGVLAQPETALEDGDEVDFIPTIAGG